MVISAQLRSKKLRDILPYLNHDELLLLSEGKIPLQYQRELDEWVPFTTRDRVREILREGNENPQ